MPRGSTEALKDVSARDWVVQSFANNKSPEAEDCKTTQGQKFCRIGNVCGNDTGGGTELFCRQVCLKYRKELLNFSRRVLSKFEADF